MKQKPNIILIILFCLTALILFAPLLQQNLNIFEYGPMVGYQEPTPKPVLSYDTYTSGEFQQQSENYLKENFGFREPLIRMYNQCTYDWFKTTSNKDVAIEKDGWLYHTEAIHQYFGSIEGRDGMSTEQLRDFLAQQTLNLYKVNTILKEYDVHLLTFTLPTKSYIYPEHLRRHPVGDTTFNAATFVEQELASYGVPHINMTPWFKQVQDTTPFDLYYSKGSHWAAGAPIAVDSMLRYMEQLGDRHLTRLQLGKPYRVNEVSKDETDLELLLNLARSLKHEPLYEYPVSLVTDDSTQYPTVWFAGTSFYWYIKRRVNLDALFRSRDFLFYEAISYTNREITSQPADSIDYLHELLLHDYVVFFRDGPQLYHKLTFPSRALISLCISDERQEEQFKVVADSLMEVWPPQTTDDSIKCYKHARFLIQSTPEMYEELRGTNIPRARNPRIRRILVEKVIRANRSWNFLLHAKARNDSLNLQETFDEEANNVMRNKLLLRDNTFFSTYDYLDLLVEEAALDIRRQPDVPQKETDIEDMALDRIEAMLKQHAFDDDTLMMKACAMDVIIKRMGDKSAMENIRNKAEARQVSIDKAFRDDAVWILNNIKDLKQYLNEDALTNAFASYRIERSLRRNKEAMDIILQKHQQSDLPLRIILDRDIEWIQNNRK